MRPHGREEPFGDGGRRQRRSVDQEDQFVAHRGDSIDAAQVAANEQRELAQQRGRARVADVRAYDVHAIRERGAHDDAACHGGEAGMHRELLEWQLTGEIVCGDEWTDQRRVVVGGVTGAHLTQRVSASHTVDRIGPSPQAAA